jgi:hypothetical protein
MEHRKSFACVARRTLSAGAVALVSIAAAQAEDNEGRFIPNVIVSSTIPANGDLNPYGVAFVPQGFPGGGTISPGDVLVANFNNSANLQATGTTIIKLTPDGAVAPAVAAGEAGNAVTFFHSSRSGLDVALGVLKRGFVVVGNLPSTDGTNMTIGQGALQVVDRHGTLVQTLTDAAILDSPWGLAIDDDGNSAHIFVANVLSGTVSRLDVAVGPAAITVLNKSVIATGYKHELSAAAFVLGPSGLAYDDEKDVLYVSSTDDNAIFAVPHAAVATHPVVKGKLIFTDPHLRGPLGLTFVPGGHLATANTDAVNGDPTHPSEIVEFTKEGEFIGQFNVDAGQGGAFGVGSSNFRFNFAAVDDNANDIAVYSLGHEDGEGR